MDVEHMNNVAKSEYRFLKDNTLVKTEITELICALKVRNYMAMQCLTTVNVEKTIPHIVGSMGLIYGFFETAGASLRIQPVSTRLPIGGWLLGFEHMLNNMTVSVCEGEGGDAPRAVKQLYSALASAGYQYGARLRQGYEA